MPRTLQLLESCNYKNEWNRKTCLFQLWQKPSNTPEKSLVRHNIKYCNITMTSHTSNLNTTELMTRKLQNKPVTMENCRTYWKKLS